MRHIKKIFSVRPWTPPTPDELGFDDSWIENHLSFESFTKDQIHLVYSSDTSGKPSQPGNHSKLKFLLDSSECQEYGSDNHEAEHTSIQSSTDKNYIEQENNINAHHCTDKFLPTGLHNAIETSLKGAETDYTSIALHYLVCFSAHTGQKCYIQIGNEKHPLALQGLLVGPSGSGKGVAQSRVQIIEQRAIEILNEQLDYHPPCKLSNLTSEGIIFEIFKGCQKDNCNEEKAESLLISEPDYTAILNCAKKPGNSLVRLLSDAYEGKILYSMKSIDKKIANHHISIIAHITPEALKPYESLFSTSSFLNRHLVIQSRRQVNTPTPRQYSEIETEQLAKWFAGCIYHARHCSQAGQEVVISARAKQALDIEYTRRENELEGMPAPFRHMLSWHRVLAWRLSALLALFDLSKTVDSQHVLMAYRLLDISKNDLHELLGEPTHQQAPKVPTTVDTIYEFIKSSGKQGVTQTEINHLFKRNKKADDIRRALRSLLESSPPRIEQFQQDGNGKGRKTTRYRIRGTK
ncbi:hypothetical protein [Endozoicomonas ascidiicola]|uniref:hypothetical protein n=1 Tax=Endozoicomonas ascidiicola TaxID=1698521 RepID=UPI000831C846|nr:hypothetical protein [Endozoicomonas ascidiicola]